MIRKQGPQDGERRMVTVLLDVPVVFSDDDRGGAWQIEERYEALGLEVMNKAEYKAACDWVHEVEDREADQADEGAL